MRAALVRRKMKQPDNHKPEPLRIVMITGLFLPETFGGAEQQCLRLSTALAASGHSVTVLTSRSKSETSAEESIDGVRIVRLSTRANPLLGGRQFGSMAWWIARVLAWIARHRDTIDIVHMHQAKANAFAGVMAGRLFGIPTIVKPGTGGTAFDFASLTRKRPLYGRLMAGFVRDTADRVIAISTALREDLVRFGVPEERIVSIPNGIAIPGDVRFNDASQLSPNRRSVDARSNICLLFAGRLERQKNVPFLIEAFARAAHQDGRLRLVLLGNGDMQPTLERRVVELGIAERVQFAGRVENVFDYMREADFFVLPTFAEGMSNALLEAMSVGLVPIATRVSGSTDLIEDRRTGALFEVNDRASFMDALGWATGLSRHEWRRASQGCQETIQAKCSMEVVRQRYEELYRALVQRRNEPSSGALQPVSAGKGAT